MQPTKPKQANAINVRTCRIRTNRNKWESERLAEKVKIRGIRKISKVMGLRNFSDLMGLGEIWILERLRNYCKRLKKIGLWK